MSDGLTDEEAALLSHLLRTHHQWHPNKKADAWVSSACFLLKKLRAVTEADPGEGNDD